jgi:ammonium transporter, Amt family
MSTNATNPTNPDWLNKGDNAWQLTAASLVALQSIPGLVVLYAGIVKRKWAVNSAFMAFYAFAAVLICWVLWAYKAAFGQQMLPFVGTPGAIISMDEELRQALLPTSGITANFPLSTMGKLLYYCMIPSCY